MKSAIHNWLGWLIFLDDIKRWYNDHRWASLVDLYRGGWRISELQRIQSHNPNQETSSQLKNQACLLAWNLR